MKTRELTKPALDWVVTKIEAERKRFTIYPQYVTRYSTDWAHGGVIIERERISIEYMAGAGDGGADVWVATRIEGSSFSEEEGDTPLVAAMRAYVASQLGDEVTIPDEEVSE